MEKLPSFNYFNALSTAYSDWLTNLMLAPQKLDDMAKKARESIFSLANYSLGALYGAQPPKCVEICKTDHRFKNQLWHTKFPYNVYAQYFLTAETIINELTHDVPKVSAHHARLVNFALRQMLDTFSPTNFPLTNPLVINTMREQMGINFIKGYLNYLEDVFRYVHKLPPSGTEQFKVGENVAVTPGKIIYRNELIEVIQYTPSTKKVYQEPILIVPACIMKYYILDLLPANSMVKYLVDSGHTVFMISWRNPDSSLRNYALSDYVKTGVIQALMTVGEIVNGAQIHAAGYCLGGTLLMLAMTFLAKTNQDLYNQVRTINLFAAQVDFKDAGELLLFIDEEQLSYIEQIMRSQGYLSGPQMASAFSMLHARDLIWSRYVQDYLLGSRYPLIDMLAWNADTTRLPYAMHKEYLRQLYLNNEFSHNKFVLDGVTLNLADIRTPTFVVSTEKDHIAPWKSVYKIHNLISSAVTFVLTAGGHNSGIVSEPGHKGRSYAMHTKSPNTKAVNSTAWRKLAAKHDGSWWVSWHQWLITRSSKQILPPKTDKSRVLCAAPGTYVLQRYYD